MNRKYCVVNSTETEDLEKQVELLMDEGWQPIGGVSVSMLRSKIGRQYTTDEERVYHQAMVRTQPND
ncbi:MAG: DUF1737 domain-containing protein [Gammaproteobacteria bacterium]|nr:DUF1737 domain-containing protein [Gammaproteobacteria bacterium]